MAAMAHILIVEDDRFIGEMYVRSLRQAGYIVDWVVSGAEGYRAVTTKHYDLLLLDIMLPEETGSQVLKDLRGKDDKIPNTKIIVLTNFAQDEASTAAMAAKADAYLIKAEITPRRLLEIISELEEKA